MRKSHLLAMLAACVLVVGTIAVGAKAQGPAARPVAPQARNGPAEEMAGLKRGARRERPRRNEEEQAPGAVLFGRRIRHEADEQSLRTIATPILICDCSALRGAGRLPHVAESVAVGGRLLIYRGKFATLERDYS